MMTWLISASLRARVLVLASGIAMIVLGLRVVQQAPMDVFPEFAPPLVEIQTEAPGLSTEEVEGLITVPLENAVNGVPWLKTVRSKTVLGLSSVVLIFEEGTDLMRARQLVQERVAIAAPKLPLTARPPVRPSSCRRSPPPVGPSRSASPPPTSRRWRCPSSPSGRSARG